MTVDPTERPKRRMGEMRRLHEIILRSGAMARVGSEARLVFAFALMYADYEKCHFTMSARGGAIVCGCHTTTFRRGIAQLRKAGVLLKGKPATQGRYWYKLVAPPGGESHEACEQARTGRVRGAHESCAQARTSGVRGAHEACAQARTGRAPYSSMPLRVSSRNPERCPQPSSAAAGAASDGTADRRTP